MARIPAPLVAAVAALLLLTACSVPTQELVVSVDLTSVERTLRRAGADDEHSFGWNLLQGRTRIGEEAVEVEYLGVVDYTDGAGPFGGHMILSWPDGDTLAVRSNGRARVDDEGATRFRAAVEVIGATGSLAGTTGRGSMSGQRRDDLGGIVELTLALRLHTP